MELRGQRVCYQGIDIRTGRFLLRGDPEEMSGFSRDDGNLWLVLEEKIFVLSFRKIALKL